jgi:hypothetical protein
MQSVYIETSVPSYYHETRRDPKIVAWREVTRQWWDEYRFGYELRTSAFTLAELSLAPGRKARAALSLLKHVPLLAEPSGFRDVVEFYVEHQLMPAEATGDAAHLALASMHHIDYLLTWNCRHLANANKIQHLTVLNGRLGLPVPIITTPLTLIPEDLR